MKFLDQQKNNIELGRWETYKQLELVPDAVDRPKSHPILSKFGVERAWRSTIALLLNELVTEQKVDYLNRCWASQDLYEGNRSPFQTLQRLLTLMS
ncbi:hypothetical protein [Chamaesiphon minutus]|uniref:Uncharacterized protein n=1 Tax=Chamaesiphon minutus (strain ATCC 27169 / PCC 6605) TaxID=1173020 RepID=K9UBS0_CHAP6|nr:hypothetical protein [Chamaesiphon minutus]AFY91871.1 hypothetical protein Cha6605_0592 [Chamaesiphon minutus PCC 6605]